MKLIMAIVNKDDAGRVADAVMDAGFFATKLATTGGFLKAGNTTFLIGTEEEKVDEVIELVGKHSKRRTQLVSASAYNSMHASAFPVEVTVGGATIFVMDVERFEKL